MQDPDRRSLDCVKDFEFYPKNKRNYWWVLRECMCGNGEVVTPCLTLFRILPNIAEVNFKYSSQKMFPYPAQLNNSNEQVIAMIMLCKTQHPNLSGLQQQAFLFFSSL